MATRPIFVAQGNGLPLVKRFLVDFRWHSGFSVTQKQKSILALHDSAQSRFQLSPLLEISSKSPVALGRNLSAFNLRLPGPAQTTITVEVAFQGSKVFEFGGPFVDLYKQSSREAKRDSRLRESGDLLYFEFDNVRWPLEPKTVFYDWLYLNALNRQPDMANQLLNFDGFTDIEFNPRRSINCQAASAALYVALWRRNLLSDALRSPDAFLRRMKNQRDQENSASQLSLL